MKPSSFSLGGMHFWRAGGVPSLGVARDTRGVVCRQLAFFRRSALAPRVFEWTHDERSNWGNVSELEWPGGINGLYGQRPRALGFEISIIPQKWTHF